MSQPAPPPAPPAPPAPPQTIAPSSNISMNAGIKPRYPPQAIRQRHEGTVVVLVLVGTDGRAKQVKIDKSSGYRELDRAAEQWARRLHYNPGKKNGQPYEAWARIPVTFNLNQL